MIKKGYFKTKWNHQPVPRYRCKECGRYFSSHTERETFGQHRPDMNDPVFKLYSGGMTQRRMAIVLGINRKTVIRKFLFAARLARKEHERRVQAGDYATTWVQFDEMETFEHTRMKPISVAVAVRARTGQILDIQCATLGYKGPLADQARRKYGHRENNSLVAVGDVLATIGRCAIPGAKVVTDADPRYLLRIPRTLPHVIHQPTLRTYEKTDRKNKNDKLFTLNYTAAKIRNDLSRMARKTWVTTKRLDRLQAHMDLYIAWNNGYELAA